MPWKESLEHLDSGSNSLKGESVLCEAIRSFSSSYIKNRLMHA